MPELPEVETVRRGLVPVLEGRVLTRVEQRRPDLRWPIPEGFSERLTGHRVERLERRAKYLLWYMDDDTVMLLHLGMSGRVQISGSRPEELDKHDHIVFTTDADTVIRFNDARRFGSVDLATAETINAHKLLASLGPEPLGNAFSGLDLSAALDGRRSPIKAALLDQRVVCGLGNIYVCEALHMSGVSPLRLATNVQGKRSERLVTSIREVLGAAIEAGGSSLRDHKQVNGELGYFQHRFRVYDREDELCPKTGCKGTIKRIVQSGRSTFYCASCQR
ncbi:MAG: bifunctional DNA-formamidopyrimidine glycosylase/DNA-(apurinic or apyrimidinic site) lyase [Alphaproteobacteria bacterium]|nr:bifunctional DNA-formamidopyrimidine glycosylase/DNA-(apurinic or apyrimidinic site) lyase [Alphaproteobacteria bacterium]